MNLVMADEEETMVFVKLLTGADMKIDACAMLTIERGVVSEDEDNTKRMELTLKADLCLLLSCDNWKWKCGSWKIQSRKARSQG